MTTELWCLVANALWGVVLVYVEVFGKTRAAGLEWNGGNRTTEPSVPAWVERASRALSNHKENFPLFLTAVVVVHLAGRTDAITGAASVVFVAARAAHGVLYVAGIAALKVRSFAYVVGMGAILAMLSRLV